MYEFFIVITVIMVTSFLLSYFIKVRTFDDLTNFVSAGSEPYSNREAVPVIISDEFVEKSKGLLLAQVVGNSAIQVNIQNNDIVAIDEKITVKELKIGDIIYLEYENHPNKFKIREFDKIKDDFIFSKTTKDSKTKPSKHPMATFKGIVKYHAVSMAA